MIITHRVGRPWTLSSRSTAAYLGLVMFAGLAGAQGFQNWNEVDLSASWRKLDFLVPAVVRTGTNLPNPQFAATGIVASVPLLRHLQLAGGYLVADLPQTSHVAHVPVIAIAATVHRRRLTVLDQNRFEKLFDYGPGPVRYRNLLLADVRFDHSKMHAFVDDEVFFNLSDSTWNQNRFQAGAGSRLNSRLSFDLYYLQRNASTGPSPVHVLGTVLTVKLTRSRT